MSGPLQFPEEPPGVFFSVGGSSDELEDKIDNQEYRNRLSEIISDEGQSSSEKLQAMLQLGTEWFDVEHGHLVRIDPVKGTHTITEVSGPHPKLSRGTTAPLSTTYCRRVIAGGDGMAVENAPEQGLEGDRAYQEFGFATYLGAKVVVGGQLYGTVCFVGEEPRVEPFTESDAAALALIVRTVGQELERRWREDRLRRTRARLEALFEESPDMIYIHDLEGNLILPNPRLCEQTGYDEEVLTDMKVWDLDRELSSEAAQALWAEMEPGDRQRREGRYQRSDGSTFPVEVDVRRLDLEGVDRFVATGRDVTRRKEQERKLAEREARYRAIAEQARDAIVTIDADSTIQFANPAVKDVFGYAPDELVGESLTTLIPERFRESHLEDVDHFLDTGERTTDWSSVEFPGVRKDGEEIELSISYSEYEHRGEMRFEGIMRDVTERNRRERKLRVLSEAMEQAREAVLITEAGPLDEPGPGIVYVNTAFEEMTGYEEDEVLGKSPRILQGPETEQEVLDSLREALEAGDPWQGETINYRKDGTSFILQWNVAPVRNGDGEIEYWMSVQRDVTEKRARDERLARMAQVLEQVDDKVVITNREGQIQYVNTAFEEITGYREEEVLGKTPAVLHSREQDDAFYEELWETLLSGETFRAEFTNERKDGTRYVENETISPVTDEEGAITHFVSSGRDITERREAQRELRETKRLLEKTLESLNEAVLVVDASDRRMVLCNAAVERMFGYEKDELVGETTEVLHVDRQAYERFGEIIAPTLSEQGSFMGEYHMRRKDGRVIDTEHMITRLQGDELLQGVVSVVRDVTERKERERELRRKERRYQAVFEDPNILVGLLDPDGRVLDMNQTVMKYTDASLEEVMGEPLWETPLFVQDEAVQERIRELIDRTVDGEYVEFELDFSEAVGEPLIVNGVFRPVRNEEGTVTSLFITGRDVTERTQGRRLLERYHDYTDRLLNASEDLFFVCDENGTLQRWNERLKVVTGYSEDELSGRSALSLVREEERDRTEAVIREVFETGRSQLEVTLLTKEGATVPYEFTGNRVEHPDGGLRLVGIGRDVTERKRREQALVEAKTKAEEASRLKSAMLANMSHEIRTPLTSVTGFTEVLKGKLEGEPKELADRIHRSGQRLMKTLDSVLQLSKLEAGISDLELEPVSLREVVAETTEMLRPSAEEKSIALSVDLAGEPVESRWNEDALYRIVENLVENAIKFTPEEGNVEVRVRAENGTAVLEVGDDGVGIREEAHGEIFQAFKQESEGLDRDYEGSGLGLSIVQQLTEAFGGEVSVESEKGEGTCFTVVLPRHSDAEPSS